jgi:hypothetical protein
MLLANYCSQNLQSLKLSFCVDVTEDSICRLVKHCKRYAHGSFFFKKFTFQIMKPGLFYLAHSFMIVKGTRLLIQNFFSEWRLSTFMAANVYEM